MTAMASGSAAYCAVGVEDDPAERQLHQLGIGGQHPDQTGLHSGQHAPGPATTAARPSPPRWRPRSAGACRAAGPARAARPHGCRPAAPADPGGRGSAGPGRSRPGRRGGRTPAAPPRTGRCGPGTTSPRTRAPDCPRTVGEVGRGLAGHQPDGHPVGVAGRGDLAEHRQQNPALIATAPGRRWPSPRPSGAGRTRPAACPAPGPAIQRVNETGRAHRHTARTTTTTAARTTRPGQPAFSQTSTSTASTASATGCRTISRTSHPATGPAGRGR